MEQLLDDVDSFIGERVGNATQGDTYREAAGESTKLFHQLRELIKDNAEACSILSDYDSAENYCQCIANENAYKIGFKDALKLFKEALN